MPFRIAVLMTCYNRVETTLRCLDLLVKQELPAECNLDIYLVDDASPDRTGEKVQKWYDALQDSVRTIFSLRVITSPGNLFWCKGMRLAWDTAIESGIDYDFYLWLNDDIQLYDGAISGLLNDYNYVLQHDETAGLIAGTFVDSTDADKLTYGLLDFNYEIARPCGKPQWVDGVNMNGNLVLVPKKIYAKVGPIYGGYWHGSGDTDYRLMAKEHGFKAYCSSRISGICPRQPECYINVKRLSFLRRMKALFSPKGMPLHDTFIYRYRHWGLGRSIVSVCHVTYLAMFKK